MGRNGRWSLNCVVLASLLLAAKHWLLQPAGSHGVAAASIGETASTGVAAAEASAPERFLATISTEFNLTGITLRLIISGSNVDGALDGSLTAYAGQSVDAVQVILASGDDFTASAPRLKFVNGTVDSAEADSGACLASATSLESNRVDYPFANQTGNAGLLVDSNNVLNSTAGLVFKMGGSFKLCYSDTGTFLTGHSDVLNVEVSVAGAYDACTATDCLAQMRYNCYAMKNASSVAGSCAISFLDDGSGLHGTVGSLTWTALWTTAFSSLSGAQQSVTEAACGSTPDTTAMCAQDSCSGTDFFIEADSSRSDRVFQLPVTQPLADATQGYTFAACYCPSLGGCDATSEYIQQVGIVHVFVSKICDASSTTCETFTGYAGVAPQTPFTVMVHCPPNGCPANDNSGVKLVEASDNNDLPSWDSSHGCHSALQTSLQTGNCESATSCSALGGERQDRKHFGTFVLEADGTDYEARNFHSSKLLDVCFCVDACSSSENWFKVGRIVHSPYRLISSAQLSIVNVPGSMGFHLAAGDEDSLGLTDSSVVKLLVDSGTRDEQCRSNVDLSQVMGISETVLKSSYLGAESSGTIVFNSGSSANLLTPVRAGVIAVCYCRLAACALDANDWVLAARVTVRGPKPDQSWSFSTGLLVQLRYEGYGLSSSDILRIVPDNVECTSSSNNPTSDTTVLVGCPQACAQVDNSATRIRLNTSALGYSTVDCDEANSNCRSVYITRITVTSSSTTELEFDGNPGLQTNDRIVLGSNIQCGSGCTDEQLASIGGARSFGDSGTYTVGVVVEATSQGHIFKVPVGWSDDVPEFDVTGGQGQWSRTSSATTAQEIEGTDERVNLRVCWAYGGDGTYVAEAGRVSFLAPPLMAAQVSLTAQATGTVAPMIISFTTAGRAAYSDSATASSLRLKLKFLDVSHLEPYYTNGEVVVSTDSPQDSTMEEASQTTCGKLFLEFWSSDTAAGFPLPSGCYYNVLGQTRELNILFEEGNGLRGGHSYQIVMMATATTLASSTVLDVIAMDDVFSKPYEVIEMGKAPLSANPVAGASGSSSQFGALSVLGGTNSLLDLEGGLDLKFSLAGSTAGPIVKESILRLFMRPLTQWDMAYTLQQSSCVAECTPHAQNTCGALGQCAAEAVVSGEQKNVVKLRLPADMTSASGSVQHEFRITGLSLPAGGFFATRIGAQISSKDDTLPHYTESSGDFLWKSPSSTVADLVVREGRGNSRPFRGDTANSLYLRLVLGATLRHAGSSVANSAASFSISLPAGYAGVRVEAAPKTLTDLVGNGYGTPSLGGWSCVSNACNYHLEANQIIPAGANIVVSLVVNNPATALRRDSASNQWQVTLRSTGELSTTQTAPAVQFHAGSDTAFGSNVAVLGRLEDYSIQPSDFTITPVGASPVPQDLFVFFKTEQSIAAGGFVVVDAPASFDFDALCSHSDLSGAYEDTAGISRTWPLPSVSSCRGLAVSGSPTSNRAELQLGGLLRRQQHYGFRLRVMNPAAFVPAQLTSWSVRTASAARQYVDGTPTTVSFNPQAGDASSGSQRSWGLYAAAMDTSMQAPTTTAQVAFHLSSMRPYSLSGEEATITVFPFITAVDLESTLRILAPLGYEWYFSEQDFSYGAVGGATAALPGKVPTRQGNALTWPTAHYRGTETYGFSTKIRVPGSTPRTASNAFFVEFGYNDETLLGWDPQLQVQLTLGGPRSLAARFPAPTVKALSNARVEYTTNVRGETNTLGFELETATRVSLGGGLQIQGPAGFLFPDSCRVEVVARGSLQPLPNDLLCTANSAQLYLTAGESGIEPGHYEFQIMGTNPVMAAANRDGENTACGWTQCWTFRSLADIKNPMVSMELDARTTAVGFAVKDEMPYAQLVPLGAAARASTARNDRPLQRNRLTFAFQLQRDVLARSSLLLRGPTGFEFEEDCLASQGVITDPGVLSATALQLLQLHGVWEPGVAVLACDGSGATARIEVGAGLKQLKAYLFSIVVKANPAQTPTSNKWTLENEHEASQPFEGFSLWTFTQTSVAALRPAAQAPAPAPTYHANVTFRPHSTVLGPGGVLVVTAPTNFELGSSSPCPLRFEERDPLHGPDAQPVAFASNEVTCLTPDSVNVLTLQLQAARSLTAGRDYTLTLSVVNPEAAAAPSDWRLQSYSDLSFLGPLDSAPISGFAVNKALLEWSYLDPGRHQKYGGAPVENLRLTMTFPDALAQPDTIVVHAPPGYDLADPANREGESRCKGLRWASGTPFTAATSVTCQGRQLTVLVGDAVVGGAQLGLYIGTRNPLRSPSLFENYWHVLHRSALGTLLSSDVVAGWAVVPQLEQAHVTISGDVLPAGATSSLDFSFVALSPAAAVNIQAKMPDGFDFSKSYLPLSGQQATLTVGNNIRGQLDIVPGVLTLVRVRDVMFASKGGRTEFDLTTLTAAGEVADERLGVQGFRLPGFIRPLKVQLQSVYRQSPELYPVKGLWAAQTGAPALALLTVSFTNAVAAGETLVVGAAPYALSRKGFEIQDTQMGQPVPTEVYYAAGGVLRARLQAGLVAGRAYRLSVPTVAPATAPTSDLWQLETLDGGELPTNLNSQVSTDFQLVSRFGLKVSAIRAPPVAEVEISVSVSFTDTARPTVLNLVAPAGYSFSAGCLVVGGTGSTVSSCEPGATVAGFSTARLAIVPGSVLQSVKLRVGTPRVSPSSGAWFVEGIDASTGKQLGWGEDSVGLQLQQMRGVSVAYAGVPDIRAQLVVGFRTSEVVDRGGQLQLMKPQGFEADCNMAAFRSITLPSILECQATATSVLVSLNGTLQRGEYAFALEVTTPQSTPSANVFSFVLMDKYGAVQDAAIDLPGLTVYQGYSIHATPLAWTSSDPGQVSSVTVGFFTSAEVPLDRLGAVLISFPDNFAHAVERPCNVQVPTTLPLLPQGHGDCSWVDIRILDRLLIYLDPKTAVPVGEFQFTFPVTVPEQLPPYNVWSLTFCKYSASISCLHSKDSDALMTFPLPGFDLGHYLPGTGAVQSAAMRWTVSWAFALLLAAFM